jgi:hypothetical protein
MVNLSEFKVHINTEQGQEVFQSEVILGELNSIIISSQEKCEVIIESEYGYILLHVHEHNGVEYYCPRARTTAAEAKLTDFPSFEKFLLNEKIIVIVRGRKNQDISITCRFQ